MSTNKMAMIRYKLLDDCFRNRGKRYTIDELVEIINDYLMENYGSGMEISKRQIYNDIEFLESSTGFNACIQRIKDGKNVYYTYADKNFSIFKTPLSEEEVKKIKEAIRLLETFKGRPQLNWIYEAITHLRNNLKIQDDNLKPFVEFQENPYLEGLEHLETFYDAILYKKVLEVEYKPFQQEKQVFEIHPYYLKQYNQRWYLIGYNKEKNKHAWLLSIDRVIDIKEKRDVEYIDNCIDFEEYFEDVIGVTKPEDEEVQEIILHVHGVTGHYIKTKPLHGSQKSKWLIENELLEVKLRVYINYELISNLLSFGKNVEVKAPEKLREIIKESLKKMNEFYE
ncbi:MAG: WYL domain-containing protein [Bacteroidia bacterium]|nr:MAG: WYL domain-containing protein [Bacteroidia bacterium]